MLKSDLRGQILNKVDFEGKEADFEYERTNLGLERVKMVPERPQSNLR